MTSAAMRRRRSKTPTADEQLDAMIEAARDQPRRAQSLEPSRTMTPSLKRTSYAAVTNTPAERRQVEEQRALPAPEDPRELGPRGPPQVFMPMVPPLPPFSQVPMVGGLQPALPAPAGPGQVGGHDGGGGMPSLLQPVQEQGWGMLAGLEQPYPGMWGTGSSADQLPVAPQGRREELPEGGSSVKGPGGVVPQELGGGRERVLEETKGSVKSSPLNPWSAEKLRELHDQARPSDPRGQGQQPRDGGDQVERLRERCLKEAEAKFQEEVRKLGQQSSNSSFQSAVEAPGGKVQGDRLQPGGEAAGDVKTTAPIVNVGPNGVGVGSVAYPWPYPPGLPGLPPWGNGVCGIFPNGNPSSANGMWMPAEESLGDNARSVELPVLGLDATALTFGDWLTTLEPIVSEISQGANQWWQLTLKNVEQAYEAWLVADPLQRLRLGPAQSEEANKWPRTERRMLSLLLQAVPDTVKSEVITARKMTVAQVLFILYIKFQTGGQGERMNLIKNLTELKLTQNVGDVVQVLRTWRRWWNRSEELGVLLPDPVVLAGVLVKASDHLAKSGAQVAYRLATSRQQLLIDTRPTLDNLKIFAEFLQAEAEELAMGSGTGVGQGKGPSLKAVATNPTSGTSSMSWTSPSVGEQRENVAGDKDTCRFWMTEKGCRRGDRCKFKHHRLSPKDNRCFHCSGLNHSRTACPFLKKEGKGEEAVKVAKVKGGSNTNSPEKPERAGVLEEEANASTSPGTTATVEEAPTGSRSTPGGGAPQDEVVNTVGGLVGEATALLKSLHRAKLMAVKCKSVGASLCGEGDPDLKVGLLDGGATHPLRTGLPDELEKAELVPVDLAHGRVSLKQDPVTGTILVEGGIEPIVPVRGLIDLGYKLQWSRSGCVVVHPKRGKISSWLRDGCPVVAEADALALIADIEEAERKKVEDLNDEENLDEDIMGWWKRRFPQVPSRVFRYMAEGQESTSGTLPWNRGTRRRLQQSKKILLHLYAGEKAEEWRRLEQDGWEVITLDITKGKDQDVHNPGLWDFLANLARKGAIKSAIGGPPCRTVSRMRFKRPGPRPLRDRGAGRFGLPNLSAGEQRLADHDTALILKQVGIYYMAEEARVKYDLGRVKTGFLLESPEDPGKNELGSVMPSFWSWEEILALEEEEGMNMVSFDQKTMGHIRKKPTTIMTNLPNMTELHELRSPPGQDEPLAENLAERMEQSRSWALWASGLRAAVWASLKLYLEQLMGEGPKIAKALTAREKEQWAQHFRQGHRPFRRDCRLCVEQMGAQRPHRRRKEGETMTSSWSMSVDIVGPLPRAKDLTTSYYMKYALIAVALVPDLGGGKEETNGGQEEEEHEDQPQEDPGQPLVEEDDAEPGELDIMKEESPEEERFHQELQESLKKVPVKHVVHVEPIVSREKEEVVVAMQKALAHFKAMGIYVNRLHSDRAKELISRSMAAWCAKNGIVPTTTAGDDPASNGHAEAEVHQIKRRVRLKLAEHGCEATSWPDAIRYVAAERRRRQLEELGAPCLPMLPYRGKVLVKVKKWHKGGGLVAPFVEARILCPSHLVNGGWVVQLQDGRVLHVREAVQTNQEGEQLRIQQGVQGDMVQLQLEEEDRPGQPHRRLTGKQPLGNTPRLGEPMAVVTAAGPTSAGGSILRRLH